MLENYQKLPNGVIKQIEVKPYKYGFDYSDKYNNLGDLGVNMGYLRLGHIIGSLGFIPNSILDIGYGNGDFLKTALNIIPKCYANDISDYPYPEGCEYINDAYSIDVDVATLYDVLEHYPDIYDLQNIRAEYLVISIPECHYVDDAWFFDWKHRKPNEHLWHFNRDSLISFMDEIGYECISICNIEDTIRKSTQGHTNIMTGVFKRV